MNIPLGFRGTFLSVFSFPPVAVALVLSEALHLYYFIYHAESIAHLYRLRGSRRLACFTVDR